MKIKSLLSSLSLLMLLPINLAFADDDRNSNLPTLYDENRRAVQGQQWDGRGYRGNYYSNRWGSSSGNDQNYQDSYNYVPQYDSSYFSQEYQNYGYPVDNGGYGFSEAQ